MTCDICGQVLEEGSYMKVIKECCRAELFWMRIRREKAEYEAAHPLRARMYRYWSQIRPRLSWRRYYTRLWNLCHKDWGIQMRVWKIEFEAWKEERHA